MPSDEQLSAAGWTREHDGTFVSEIGELFTRRVGGRVEVALQTDKRHANLSGLVHGGVIVTLLDRVIGVNCREATGGRASTVTITVNFINPVRIGEFLATTCILSKVGRSVVFAEARATVDERVVATASSTCLRRFGATSAPAQPTTDT